MSAGLEAFRLKTPEDILVELRYALLKLGTGGQVQEIRDQSGETIVFSKTTRADLMQLINYYEGLTNKPRYGQVVTVNPFGGGGFCDEGW